MPDDTLPLEHLAQEAETLGPVKEALKKLNYTHEALVDLMVSHPELNQNQLASAFGYTAAWLSTIVCSDAFQARLAQKREEIIDPVLRLTVEERFKAMVNRSFEVLMEKLHAPQVSENVAIRCAEMGARVLAVKAGKDQLPPPLPPGERLTKLAGRLRDLQRGDVVDVTPKEAT